jgi:glutamate/aspartate transport system permease protein
MDWAVIPANLPFLMNGLVVSFQLAAITIVLSFVLGCFVAVGRISKRRWFFFLVPLLTGKAVGNFASVLTAFVVFFSAYFAEIVRSGIQSVGRNQIQAGLSTGLTYAQSMRLIVLPQALRSMLPALVTECIIVFQGTTIAYVVGLREFLHSTFLVTERTVRPVELYLFAAAVYFVICFTGSMLARKLEKKAVRVR